MPDHGIECLCAACFYDRDQIGRTQPLTSEMYVARTMELSELTEQFEKMRARAEDAERRLQAYQRGFEFLAEIPEFKPLLESLRAEESAKYLAWLESAVRDGRRLATEATE